MQPTENHSEAVMKKSKDGDRDHRHSRRRHDGGDRAGAGGAAARAGRTPVRGAIGGRLRIAEAMIEDARGKLGDPRAVRLASA
jgi:hypothetical protein